MIDYLSKSSLFQGLSNDFLTSLAPHTLETPFRKGDYLFREGEPADRLYILEKGQVILSVMIRFPTRRSEREVDLGVLNPLDVFGISSVILHSIYRFSARAASDGVCVEIDGEYLAEMLAGDTQVEALVMKRTVALLQKRLDNTLEILAYERATQPGRYYLLDRWIG